MNSNSKIRTSILTFFAMLLAACGSGGSSDPVSPPPPPTADRLVSTPKAQLQLAPSQSCDDLKDYVADSIAELLLNSAGIF